MAPATPSESREIVRRNVKKLRAHQELTQEQLAAKAGVSREYLAHLEARGKNISIDVLTALAKALDVDPRELLTPEDEWNKS